jgi:hypothetical protein
MGTKTYTKAKVKAPTIIVIERLYLFLVAAAYELSLNFHTHTHIFTIKFSLLGLVVGIDRVFLVQHVAFDLRHGWRRVAVK